MLNSSVRGLPHTRTLLEALHPSPGLSERQDGSYLVSTVDCPFFSHRFGARLSTVEFQCGLSCGFGIPSLREVGGDVPGQPIRDHSGKNSVRVMMHAESPPPRPPPSPTRIWREDLEGRRTALQLYDSGSLVMKRNVKEIKKPEPPRISTYTHACTMVHWNIERPHDVCKCTDLVCKELQIGEL